MCGEAEIPLSPPVPTRPCLTLRASCRPRSVSELDTRERMEVLISEEQIARRVRELAKEISADYQGKTVHLICVLKGAILFSPISRERWKCR